MSSQKGERPGGGGGRELTGQHGARGTRGPELLGAAPYVSTEVRRQSAHQALLLSHRSIGDLLELPCARAELAQLSSTLGQPSAAIARHAAANSAACKLSLIKLPLEGVACAADASTPPGLGALGSMSDRAEGGAGL